MLRYRSRTFGLGTALAAVSLIVVGTTASYGSLTGVPSSAPSLRSHDVVPNPDAPHVGTVAGLQTGLNSAINSPRSLRTFRDLTAQMLRPQTTPARRHAYQGYLGTSFNIDTVGAQASQSITPRLHFRNEISSANAPRLLPSGGPLNGSCIEMDTLYNHVVQYVAAYDWCVGKKFSAELPIDKDFVNTYTKSGFYSTQIVQTDAGTNTWTSYLYNYQDKTWQQFFEQHGTSQLGPVEGWDLYNVGGVVQGNGHNRTCRDLRHLTFASKDIMVGVNGGWAPADPTHAGNDYDSPLQNFFCDSLSYKMVEPYSHWRIIG